MATITPEPNFPIGRKNRGYVNEDTEGPRVTNYKPSILAADKLAGWCIAQKQMEQPLPNSLDWSCKNWKILTKRMKQ